MGCSVYSNVCLIKNFGYNDCIYVLAFLFLFLLHRISTWPFLHIGTKSVWENSIKDSSLSVFFHETHTLVSGGQDPVPPLTQQMQVSGGGFLWHMATACSTWSWWSSSNFSGFTELMSSASLPTSHGSCTKCFDCSITHHCCRSESWGLRSCLSLTLFLFSVV